LASTAGIGKPCSLTAKEPEPFRLSLASNPADRLAGRGRRLNAGQRAIMLALAYPEPTKLKRAGSLQIKEQVNSGALLRLGASTDGRPSWSG